MYNFISDVLFYRLPNDYMFYMNQVECLPNPKNALQQRLPKLLTWHAQALATSTEINESQLLAYVTKMIDLRRCEGTGLLLLSSVVDVQ